jgi:hypothetical protein
MKELFFIVFAIYFATSIKAQTSQVKDSCLFEKDLSVRPYIVGDRDTIVKGINAKVINRALIKNGLEVMLTDTSYKIVSYSIEFVIDDPVLIVSAFNLGSKLQLLPPYDGYLKKLKSDELFILTRIRVTKNNQCYTISNSIYFLTR